MYHVNMQKKAIAFLRELYNHVTINLLHIESILENN